MNHRRFWSPITSQLSAGIVALMWTVQMLFKVKVWFGWWEMISCDCDCWSQTRWPDVQRHSEPDFHPRPGYTTRLTTSKDIIHAALSNQLLWSSGTVNLFLQASGAWTDWSMTLIMNTQRINKDIHRYLIYCTPPPGGNQHILVTFMTSIFC